MALWNWKPLRGWRVFAGEVGTIVLGILISLLLSQLISRANNRDEANQLVGSMRSELAEDLKRYRINSSALECLDRSLDRLLVATASAPLPADFPPLAHKTSFWTMHTSAWEMARTNPALTELPLETRDAYASLYAILAFKQQDFARTDAEVREVRLLMEAGDAPARRADLRLAALRAQGGVRDLLSDRQDIFDNGRALGIDPGTDRKSLSHASYDIDGPCPFPAGAVR
ncbi:hypothetical protein ABDK56_11590 [Sphingomonas sp. ASV193]|uniref:hypothetical protein n=1 Tax=Sphingomonas sp. ASV193 TaxID=3144405 RepID=UPI0032E851F8